ncbi:MAG: sulfatase-like hydrolase/transferase [Planctomycetota bacterium]
MRILYLDLDALNPLHLGCYGYHRNTSPAIDAVAAEGVRFTNVYCSDAPCLPSRTALYTGRFGIHTGVVGHGGTAADPKRQGRSRGFLSTYETDSFPRQLQQLGLHTAMISPFGQRHAAHQYYAGFKEIHNTGGMGQEPAEVVQTVVREWLDRNASNDDWYLHINFWDIHTNYRVPIEYGNPFEGEPVADWFTDEVIERHVRRGGPHSAQDLNMFYDSDVERYPRTPPRINDRASLTKWIDGYDTAIRYVDDCIAEIVAKLKAAGVYDDTAIIISADHGENQGDLGIYGEHGTADRGTCHIPMIVKWPGHDATAGRVDEALRYHLDWGPTCLNLMGAGDNCPDVWDGVDYSKAITGGDDEGRSELIMGQCAHVVQRSVRFNDGPRQWLYMRTYDDGLHPFDKHMLFDLASDPHEQHDVADKHPDVLREATWRLMNWHDDAMATVVRDFDDVSDPLYTVLAEDGPLHARYDTISEAPVDLDAYLVRLEATGRAEAAADLRQRRQK